MSEQDIVNSILDYLNLKGHRCWRNNTGAFPFESKGVRRYIRAGFPGSSDIIGIAKDGKFIAVEVKKPGGKLTENQMKFLEMIGNNGGYAILAFSIDDV